MSNKKKVTKLSPTDSHPFSPSLLDDDFEQLPSAFANRRQEIRDLETYTKRYSLIGVQGPLGSGKTTLLNHFCRKRLAISNPVVFLQLASESHARPFSQIALAVLQICGRSNKQGRIKIRSDLKMNFAEERKRLKGELKKNLGLKLEFKPVVEIPNMLKASAVSLSVDHMIAHRLAQYDDSSALDLLRKLIHHSETRFYVVLDDFHHLRRFDDNENYYPDFINFAEKFRRVLRHPKVTFLITLDDIVVNKRKHAEQESGGRAEKYTDKELGLKGFTPASIAEMIVRRLMLFDYPRGKTPEFSDECVLLTAEASNGNPRLILDILSTAMDHAKGAGKVRISFEDIVHGITEETGVVPLDEFESKILSELRERGGRAMAKDFSEDIGSQTTIYNRLKPLVQRGILVTRKTGKGSQAPNIYEFALVDWPI